MSVLKSLFNFAIRMELYDRKSPVVGVKLFKEPKQKLRFLEPEEERALVAEPKEPLRTLAILGIHTGIRVASEGLSLGNQIALGR